MQRMAYNSQYLTYCKLRLDSDVLHITTGIQRIAYYDWYPTYFDVFIASIGITLSVCSKHRSTAISSF